MKQLFSAPLFTLICVLTLCQTATAQSYFIAGFTGGFPKYNSLDAIVKKYNSNSQHKLDNFGFMPGFEFGVGTYGERTMMEAKIASVGQTVNSHVPNANPEDVSLDFSYTYLNYSFGYRPFKKTYFTVGGGINVGMAQTRYSFLSDWQVMNQDYMAGSELFVDYAFPIKLKRRRAPYLLRIRPYYQQFFGIIDLQKLNTNFNEVSVNEKLYQDPSHFGVHLSLVIPFGKDKKVAKQPLPSVTRILPGE